MWKEGWLVKKGQEGVAWEWGETVWNTLKAGGTNKREGTQTFRHYLQLCTWDAYHIFLIATLVFARLLLDEIYHLIELLFDWLMWCWFLFACWIDFRFYYSFMIWETGVLELASTIIFVLQVNQLTKFAGQPAYKLCIFKWCCCLTDKKSNSNHMELLKCGSKASERLIWCSITNR